jgi:peptidoglycan/xylan/chitin deacetylase (PgdA/CDA1 family)
LSEPGRKAFFHVDTDGLAAIYRGHGKVWEGRDPFFLTAADSALLFFEEIGAKATFFVIAEDLDDADKRRSLQSIVDAGHEIACHGFHHRYLNRVDSKLKHEEIVDAKARIEDVVGRPVWGFRAPGYSIDWESIEILGDAGYDYDSTVFPNPTFRDRLGVQDLRPDPFEILPLRGLMEFPMPTSWPGFPPFHPCYAFYLRRPYFRGAMRRFARRARHLTLLFHFTDFAEPQDGVTALRLRVFTNDFFSAASKRRFLRRLVGDVRETFEVDTTEAFLDARWV